MSRLAVRSATITGIGLFTSLGRRPGEVFGALCDGRSGLRRPICRPISRPISGPTSRTAGSGAEADLDVEVAGFAPPIEPTEVLPARDCQSVDRFVTMALAAAGDALADAALVVARDVDPLRVAVVVSSAGGGMTTYEAQALARRQRGRVAVSPYLLPGMMSNMAAARIAIRFGVRGFTSTISTACAGGGQAVGEALRLIRGGEADVVLCGGAEAPLTPTTVAGFANAGLLAHGWADPAAASRPFDRARNGIVLAEGAAILVVERTDHARARGAAGYADVLGWGATTDAHHSAAPRPDGRWAKQCMRQALADAGIDDVGSVDYVNAHATATKLGDRAEAHAVADVFGSGPPLVSSTKAVTGHLLGAAGAVEAAATAMSVAEGVVPPTHNLSDPDPACELNHVFVAKAQPVRVAITNSFGFGGHNVSVVLGEPTIRRRGAP